MRNAERKDALKQVLRRIRKHAMAGETAQAQALIPQLMTAADKAAGKGAIHRKKAARIKSRVMRRLAAGSAAAKAS